MVKEVIDWIDQRVVGRGVGWGAVRGERGLMNDCFTADFKLIISPADQPKWAFNTLNSIIVAQEV